MGATTLVALSIVSVAAAHITANPGSAPANAYLKADFRVPHGCAGSPTVGLTVKIPSGVVSVKPEHIAGWDVQVTAGPLDEPYVDDGETITEGVTEISWTGGNLPDEQYQDFGISMKLPDKAGETIYFPTVQTCDSGEVAWIEIPEAGEDEPEHPAPAIVLTAATAGGGDEYAIPTEVMEVDNSDGPSDGLVWTALVAGIVGILAGGSGLFVALRRK